MRAALLAALLLVALGIGTVTALAGESGPGAPSGFGGDRAFFLVSTAPAGAEISLEDLGGTRYPAGTTSAGPLNVTVYLTATPMRSIVANLSGYRDAVFEIAQYPAKGETIPVSLVLEPTPAPVANFTANATDGPAPLAVQFTDASTGSPTGWSWEFGDGGTSTEQHPVHVYAAPGNFTATLTVTGPGGSDSEEKPVSVREILPALALALAVSADNGTTWHDAGTAPGPSLPPTGPAFQVRFVVTNVGNVLLTDCSIGGGAAIGPLEPGRSSTVQENGTWAAGQQAVTATAYGYHGLRAFMAPDTVYYVGLAPPVANFTANATFGFAPHAVQFTDISTGSPTGWAWEFGDGGTSTEQHPVHVYDTFGVYTVNLTVTGPGGSDSEERADYVGVEPPFSASESYFLVSTAPAGAEVFLEGLGGTRYPVGTTAAGPLNVTLCRTCTPIRKVVATLPGYLEAAWAIDPYPAVGETVPVHLVLAPGTGGPFPAPHVPSTLIQAEDYDYGGEGAAYHDAEPRNLGGAYRPGEGVDVESANGVTNVGWIRSGEYLDYTVDTTVAGYFWLTLRAANPDPGRKPVQVLLNGTPVTEVIVGSTGSWTGYAEYSSIEPFALRAGRHTVTLAFGETDRLNLDWLRLSAGPAPAGGGRPYPSAHAVPGRVEAEDYDVGGFSDTTPANEGGAYRTDAVDIERGGSGYNVGWIRPGEYLQYSVDAATAGTYAVSFRISNPGTARNAIVWVNGGPRMLTVPATGSFGTWQTAVLEGVRLSAGRNTVRLETGGASSFNLDYLTFSTGATVTTPTPAQSGGASFTAAPLSAPRGAAVKFAVTPAAGKTIRSAWWSFDAPAHLSTWNSRAVTPTFFYPAKGTFSPLVKLVYTDGSTETVQRTSYVRAT